MTRLGVLGGTFDPVHLGHLVLAEEVRDRASLDRVLFVPAARSPHKDEEPHAPPDARRAMVEAAIADHPAFELATLELERGGVSYTIDTLRALRAARPEAEIRFLLGADALPDLPHWHRAGELLAEFRFHVATRPDHPLAAFDDLAPALGSDVVERLRLDAVEIPAIGISSTDLRRRVRAGRSIRHLVPSGVAEIVRERGLYR